MPSEQAVAVDVPEVVTVPQIKLCATCHNPLTELPEFLSPDLCSSGPVCSACADRARLRERLVLNEIAPRLRRQSTLAPMVEEPTEYTESHPPPTVTTPPAERTDLTLAIPHSFDSHTLSSPDSPPPRDRRDSQPKRQAVSRPDPFSDVTRLRLNNTRQDCLYPGATFAGIQKSGRNSYNVAVTIVNVDFPGSTLCGYLTIENLTEDHPQLTTYFDAEIIGPKYGFLTQSYGASESDDMTHWGRFDPFRAIKSEMRRPGLTIRQKSLTERGFVFMRWKERFLVPEHQVRGIRGASYDGFYYVCVQLGTPADSPSPVHGHHYREPTSPVQSYHHLPHHSHHSHHSHPTPPTRTRTMSSASANSARSGPISPEVHEDFPPLSPVSSTRRHSHSQPHPHSTSPTSPRITRSRDSFSGCGGGRGSFAPRTTATMTGFYFHQNSEPYQQLTLHHQPERTIPTFEFC